MSMYGKSVYGRTVYGLNTDYIFDRTETDLINDTEKAYINYTDLNRIESGMKRIADKYSVSITVKMNWKSFSSSSVETLDNFPLKPQMQRIINNLNRLIEASGYTPTVKVPTDFENMDIYKMNNLEKILDEMEYLQEVN